MKIKPVIVFPTQCVCLVFLVHFIPVSRTLENVPNGGNLRNSVMSQRNGSEIRLPVLYDSASMDAGMQQEMVKSVLLALGDSVRGEIRPLLLEVSDAQALSTLHSLEKSASILLDNDMKVLVSLLDGEELTKFVYVYENLSGKRKDKAGSGELYIYTPRSFSATVRIPNSVKIHSLQMSNAAHATALLNRVKKVGVNTLIPILDRDNSPELESLVLYQNLVKEGKSQMRPIRFTNPIFLNDPLHRKKLKMILQEHSGFQENYLSVNTERSHDIEGMSNTTKSLKPGILLLAKKNAHEAVRIASEKSHLLLSWFSPYILEIEEWVHRPLSEKNIHNSSMVSRTGGFQSINVNNEEIEENSSKGTAANNSIFGLYTVSFAGSGSWDNPSRRRILRELASFAGNSPRILASVLAYDAALLAKDHVKKGHFRLSTRGLSGDIDFGDNGFRKRGTFLGASSVPKTESSPVALLQPSTWILEDIITLNEKGAQERPKITDYDVATSSILSSEELVRIANTTRDSIGCTEHLMDIVTYDPFSQLPFHYFFTESNLPEIIMVPNHQGFGISFVCSHINVGEYNDNFTSTSTLQVACTPGERLTHPVNCFRSHVARRQKRAASDINSNSNSNNNGKVASPVPSVQYQYSISGNDPWYSQNSQWAASKQDAPSSNYYQPPSSSYQVESITYGYPTTRLDIPIVEEVSTTPAPTGSKLPELRQILKAAKPFVGSCIGSSTGCAICVLVLGRLPLGNNPTACTGPCFVGTFGSCGALLGRVFAETTVICTELFRQGLLDTETFVADAEFGSYLAQTSPYTMKGYTLLATPLVDLMQSSQFVTEIVATFALPWAHHMKFLLGRTEETNLLGNVVHSIGYPVCNTVGRLAFVFNNIWNYLSYSLVIVSPVLTFVLTLLYILAFTNLGFSTNHKRLGYFSYILKFCTLLWFIQKTLHRVVIYFKAIGRRT